MRLIEKLLIFVFVIAFITALGMGFFDIYVEGYAEGVDLLTKLGTQSTEGVIAITALVGVIWTLVNSSRGKKKRKVKRCR